MTWGELFKYMRKKNLENADFLRETVFVWDVSKGEFFPADLLETGKDDVIIGGDRLFISITGEQNG
jgi:hypothetical protein